MLVWKEVIPGPGTYWYLDQETNLPRTIRFTPEGIRHLHDQGKRMLQAGLSIPVPVEHQPTAVPLTAPQKAAQNLLNNAGWVSDWRLHGEGLWSLVDVQDPEIAKKLPKTIRWTSPWITSFMDGDGRKWEGVVGHLALTTRPRISKQQPFPSVAAAMSWAGLLHTQAFDPAHPGASYAPGKGLAFSRAGLLSGEGTLLKPAYPVAFSLYSGGIPLAAPELMEAAAKPKPKPKEPPSGPAKGPPGDAKVGDVPAKPEGTPAPGTTPPGEPGQPGMPGMPGMEPSLVDSDGDIPVHEVIGDLLETMGVLLEEGTTGDNFLERLYKAVMSKMKEGGKMGADMGTDPNNLTNQPPGGKNPNDLPPNPPGQRMNVVQEQPPLYMSLADAREKAKGITDPTARAMVDAMLSHQEVEGRKTAALQQRMLAEAKAVRDRRVEAACRRNPSPAFREKVLAMVKDARLSIADDGTIHDTANAALEVVETMVSLPDLLLSRHATQQDHPQDAHPGEISQKRMDDVADEFCRNVGINVPQANGK
jgi:hypothetical protein